MNTSNNKQVVLIGAGIMSATLGILLKELNPDISISIFERLDRVAAESSDALNNAGTGHSAFCELNYTPQLENGTLDISKAIKIASSFEVSKAFWAYLVKQNYFDKPESFINNIPHLSFVWGEENIEFLKKRHEAMIQYPLFEGMEFSDNVEELTSWIPLVMKGRAEEEKVAATRMQLGTDVNFGTLAQVIFDHLATQDGVSLHLLNEVKDLDKQKDGRWKIEVKDLKKEEEIEVIADFVFIGAGGGALRLLEKSNIEEGEGFGGFPVSGQWLICHDEAIIAQHQAKVYGKASVGAPPMSVPHLDTRIIDGKKSLLFGPFAGFSTKFLKNGSYLDLPLSIEFSNILPMLGAGLHNLPLTKYLIEQVRLSPEDKLEALKEYYPEARMEDWELAIAGQRVQVIKKDKEEGGILEFGTEIINAADGSLAALLGASPGASTSVSIMLELLQHCFPVEMASVAWQEKLKRMIPCYGESLKDNAELCRQTRSYTSEVLHLLD